MKKTGINSAKFVFRFKKFQIHVVAIHIRNSNTLRLYSLRSFLHLPQRRTFPVLFVNFIHAKTPLQEEIAGTET